MYLRVTSTSAPACVKHRRAPRPVEARRLYRGLQPYRARELIEDTSGACLLIGHVTPLERARVLGDADMVKLGAAPYRARRTSERAERAHLCVGVREQQIGSLPASPEVTTAWTRAPEPPTAQLAGCRIPKAQNPRLRIPIPKSPKVTLGWEVLSRAVCVVCLSTPHALL